MSCKKIITFLFIFFTGLTIPEVKAQELNVTGDSIFVNVEVEIEVKFPVSPSRFKTEPTNAEYSLRGEGTSVIISARIENSKTASLLVSEGNRHHQFFLVFKKDIDFSNEKEITYDYSTEQILRDHIRAAASRKQVKQEKQPVTSDEVTVPDNSNLAQKEIDRKYENLIAVAKIYLEQKKYAQARETYQKALDLKPGDSYSGGQMETVRKLELDETRQKNLDNSKNLYNDYISQGDKAYVKSDLTGARIAYQQALTIKPNDAIATSRLKLIDDKEKIQSGNEERENNYNTAIATANTLLQAEDLEGARAEYAKALGIFKRPFPQEQIKIIDKKIADQAANEIKTKQLLEQQLNAEKQRIKEQQLENDYAAAVRSADAFYNGGDYDNAKIEYNKALDIIKKDWPRDQINLINKILADRAAQESAAKQEQQRLELERKYTAAMEGADKYFAAGDYTNAKIMYNRALSLIPRPEPQDKIKEINKIIADRLAKENEEKLRLAHEAEITSRFETLVKNADAEFNKNNYIKAKQLYTQASNLKPAEDHPKDRLTIIENTLAKIAADIKARNDSIALAKDINRKYNVALSQGKSSFQKDDLLNAKIFYEEAVNLKPSEEGPKKQLSIIINKLADMARQKELDDNYELKLNLASNQIVAKEFDSALATYNEALNLKPSELYPKAQIKYIQSELAEIERRKEIARRQDLERRYNDDLNEAVKAVTDKRYKDAQSFYVDALTIHPENQNAKDRLKIINYQVEKARTDSLDRLAAAKEPVPVTPKRKKSSDKDQEKPQPGHLVFQANPLPYSIEELKSKYPNIDFSALPPEQPFNKLAVSTKENLTIYDSLVLEKPRLDLSTGDGGIKLIVEGINFEETISYVKVRIQNNSNADFLTGAMMLTWTKKNGIHIKLYPNHLFPSPLPVIKPAYEAVVIYACKTYTILDADLLTFELIDRFKKFKLQVNIPGSVYSQEWVRYE